MFGEEETDFLEKVLFRVTGIELPIENIYFISGGIMNHAIEVHADSQRFFVKWNEGQASELLEKESKGLDLLRAKGSLKVPKVLGVGEYQQRNFLVLEFIPFTHKRKTYWEELGRGLANLHNQTTALNGLPYHNYLGKFEQRNVQMASWRDFFYEYRLRSQFGLAVYKQHISKDYLYRIDALQKVINSSIPDISPSLLHGDLWEGNLLVATDGSPCIIDPAVYYGHREMDIAHACLFGGIPEVCWEAYNEAYPLEKAWQERQLLYQLYPLMVQVNLYGSGYLNKVDAILKKFSC